MPYRVDAETYRSCNWRRIPSKPPVKSPDQPSVVFGIGEGKLPWKEYRRAMITEAVFSRYAVVHGLSMIATPSGMPCARWSATGVSVLCCVLPLSYQTHGWNAQNGASGGGAGKRIRDRRHPSQPNVAPPTRVPYCSEEFVSSENILRAVSHRTDLERSPPSWLPWRMPARPPPSRS